MVEVSMSGSVNKVILIGNLGRDPETRQLGSGDSVVNFSVATTESWKDKASGEKRDRTEWHNVVIFNEGLGKVAQQYLRKGSKVYLEGQVQTRKFQDKSGQERQTTEIVLQRYRGELTLLDGRSGGGAGSSSGGGGEMVEDQSGGNFGRSSPVEPRRSSAAPSGGGSGGRMSEALDDDIPF
jgi:single-strand DNA-binding protein